jgi:hypothetical protein
MPSCTKHRQLGAPRQDLVHQALEVGGQMLNDHERHARVGRYAIEEAFEGFQAAG